MRYALLNVTCRKWLRFLQLSLLSFAIAIAPHDAMADEMPEGMLGWWYFITYVKSGYAPDPVTACTMNAKNQMNRPLLDIKPREGEGPAQDCKYLHAFNAVNEVFGPQWYSATWLRCKPDYFAKFPGVCVKRPELPAPTSCSAGQPGFVLGNPVTVSSGAKVQSEIDFPGTRAGALQITRTCRPFSEFISGQSGGTNWSFSFDRVLTIQRWSADGRPLNLVGTAGDASHFSFYWNSTNSAYESTLDKTATLVPLSSNYDEWLMVTNGRADRFKQHVSTETPITRYQLISSQALDGGIQHYSYDPLTLALKTITDEHGRRLEIGWGPYSVASISGPEGTVKYSYDWLSLNPEHEIPYTRRLIAVEFFDPDGASVGRKQYHYEDKFHRYFLTGITDEDGKRFATYTYDSTGRTLTSEHASGANRYTFAYPNDTTRVVTDPSGAQRTIGIRRFSGVGVSTGASQPAGAGCNASVSAITHDGSGNVESQTDFNGNKTCFVHDSTRGLEIRRVSGLSGSNLCPGSDDDTITATNVRQIRTKWHPHFALRTALAEPKRITTYLYSGQRDAKGVPAECGVTVTLANGEPLPRLCKKTVQPTTDPDGRTGFAARSAGTARVWIYEYDTDGKLVKQTGPGDGRGHAEQETRFYYEDTGASHTAQQFRLSYTYGSEGANTGHVRSITYPSGNRVDITYGSDGRPTSLSLDAPDAAAPVTLIKGITYRPFGGVAGWAWGNSTSSKPNIYARKFDLDGRIVSFPLGHTEKNGVVRTIAYDTVDRIMHTQHAGTWTASALDQRYFYDELDRLTGFDAPNVSHGFSYDKNGNRSAARFGGTTYKYTTSSASNRLNSTTGPVPAKVNTYDAAGNITTDGTIQYSYGPDGRLQSAQAGGIKTTYHYNGFGQRVAKSEQKRLTSFYVYDGQSNLLGEYDAGGLPVQETIYFGDLPIAVIKPGTGTRPPAIHYIYADHLQTPRVITRASDNTMVWRWDQADPFGLYQPNENPSGVGVFTYNPRFPGQLFDKETNNHYNYFRDYDPQTGRYIQSDPIGLQGGINTYAYVESNPLSQYDPRGLASLNLFAHNGKDGKVSRPGADLWNIPNVYTVAGHGNPGNMEDWRAGKYTPLFPEDLARIIENDKNWDGKPITLGSRNTGNSWPSGFGRRKNWMPFAQDLANRLGVPVTAPLEFSWFSAHTGMRGAAGPGRPPDPGSIGRWKTFYPQSSASK